MRNAAGADGRLNQSLFAQMPERVRKIPQNLSRGKHASQQGSPPPLQNNQS